MLWFEEDWRPGAKLKIAEREECFSVKGFEANGVRDKAVAIDRLCISIRLLLTSSVLMALLAFSLKSLKLWF